MSNTPVVHITSTSEDLREYRNAARDAALRARFIPTIMEYFAAGGNPPLDVCLQKISGSGDGPTIDILIVIVAHRYGWVPNEIKGNNKSITWLECEEAAKLNIPILAFLLDDTYEWPDELKDSHLLIRAMSEGKATAELFTKINNNISNLEKFKSWLQSNYTPAYFTTPDSLAASVLHSLYSWRQKKFEPSLKLEPQVFVAMPFSDNMDDTYHYGILGAIKGAGYTCERADLTSFTGDVMEWVKERIENASLIIADLSGANPNVYLEVGYAWACDKPTILLINNIDHLTFDVQSQKCLTYNSINELEEKLKNELIKLKQKLNLS